MDEFFGTFFGSTVVSQQLAYLEASLLKDIWETFYSTVLSTFFAYVIGLPLGIILVTGEPDGVRPLPRALMRVINVIVNLLRSVPFLILMVLVIPCRHRHQRGYRGIHHPLGGGRLPLCGTSGGGFPAGV